METRGEEVIKQMNTKISLAISFLLGALTIGIFNKYAHIEEQDALTFPLYGAATSCVREKLDSISWIDPGDVTFLTFSLNPTSVIPVSGFVRLSLQHHDQNRLEPVVNAVFHDCYPRNISMWQLTDPQVQSLQNAMIVLQSQLTPNTRRVSLELDAAAKQLKYSIWP